MNPFKLHAVMWLDLFSFKYFQFFFVIVFMRCTVSSQRRWGYLLQYLSELTDKAPANTRLIINFNLFWWTNCLESREIPTRIQCISELPIRFLFRQTITVELLWQFSYRVHWRDWVNLTLLCSYPKKYPHWGVKWTHFHIYMKHIKWVKLTQFFLNLSSPLRV